MTIGFILWSILFLDLVFGFCHTTSGCKRHPIELIGKIDGFSSYHSVKYVWEENHHTKLHCCIYPYKSSFHYKQIICLGLQSKQSTIATDSHSKSHCAHIRQLVFGACISDATSVSFHWSFYFSITVLFRYSTNKFKILEIFLWILLTYP